MKPIIEKSAIYNICLNHINTVNSFVDDDGNNSFETMVREIEEYVSHQRQEIEKELSGNLKDWCFEYLADCNSNLEFNRPSPPIWEYLDKKLSAQRLEVKDKDEK